jgi:hypothetical protein
MRERQAQSLLLRTESRISMNSTLRLAVKSRESRPPDVWTVAFHSARQV